MSKKKTAIHRSFKPTYPIHPGLFFSLILVLIILLGIIAYASGSLQNMQSYIPNEEQSSVYISSDNQAIHTALQKEIPQISGVKTFTITSSKVQGDFAKVTIHPLDVQTDDAMVILQKKNGAWQIIWGPGTDMITSDPIFKILPTGF